MSTAPTISTPPASTRVLPPDDEMYRALVDRDPSYEGIFVACVRTTGIFCRPTCRARKPRRGNVEFVGTVGEALFAGYRPCKVCHPMEAGDRRPGWVRELMARVEGDPATRITDGDLRAMSIDPARARRHFLRHYRMTFHAWQRACRLGSAVRRLREGRDIVVTGLDAGFESTSGFREAFARLFGDPPGRGRDAACLVARTFDTPLGPMLAIASPRGVALLEFVDRRALETQVATVRRRFRAVIVPGANEHLEKLDVALTEYFAGSRTSFDVALDAPGTPFQMLVWNHLRRIPPGEVRSYSALADEIGHPGANRAVGRANGTNRVAIVIPCHRVIRADGSLCGYGGGPWRKRWLLEHERADA